MTHNDALELIDAVTKGTKAITSVLNGLQLILFVGVIVTIFKR